MTLYVLLLDYSLCRWFAKNDPKSLTLPCVHTHCQMTCKLSQSRAVVFSPIPPPEGKWERYWRDQVAVENKNEFWQWKWSCLERGKVRVRVRVEIIIITWLDYLGLLLSCLSNRMWKKRRGSSSEPRPPKTEFFALPVASLHLSERGNWDNTWKEIWVVKWGSPGSVIADQDTWVSIDEFLLLDVALGFLRVLLFTNNGNSFWLWK